MSGPEEGLSRPAACLFPLSERADHFLRPMPHQGEGAADAGTEAEAVEGAPGELAGQGVEGDGAEVVAGEITGGVGEKHDEDGGQEDGPTAQGGGHDGGEGGGAGQGAEPFAHAGTESPPGGAPGDGVGEEGGDEEGVESAD